MKAIAFRTHGGPEVLEYLDFPLPEIHQNQVLVQIKSAALNRLDLWVRAGWPGIRLDYPHIPGADGAGIVAEIGSEVTQFTPGDRVVINPNLSCGKCEFCIAGADNRCRNWALLGETIRGTYAEFVSIPETNLFKIPDEVEFRTASAAGLVYQTAWHSLIERGKVQPGETVLIVGASGGVNTASIQVAKLAGAEVFVIGSSPAKLALAESLGADHLVDRTKNENWSKVVYELTQKRGVDLIVDNIGTTFPHSFRAAAKGGRILTVGNTGGARIEIDNRFVFGKHLSLLGSTMGTRSDFEKVMSLVFERKLSPVLDRDFPLTEARKAQEYLEHGNQLGKITLSIS